MKKRTKSSSAARKFNAAAWMYKLTRTRNEVVSGVSYGTATDKPLAFRPTAKNIPVQPIGGLALGKKTTRIEQFGGVAYALRSFRF
jgi:hypothetical protein